MTLTYVLTEVENFIKANIQELGKDKWLCPLSGKKFRAAEFVRKHIFNKHADKVEAVKLEVRIIMLFRNRVGPLHSYLTFKLSMDQRSFRVRCIQTSVCQGEVVTLHDTHRTDR